MARVRTFIGIDPGKTIRDRLIALQQTLNRAGAEVKWVEPENLHVTLLFLGEVLMTDVPAICAAVADVASSHPAFPLSIETTGCFPNPRRPRILWVGVGEGALEVTALYDALQRPLLDLGCYRREERQYTPHITLGRVKSGRPNGGDEGTPSSLATVLVRYADWKGGVTTVREVHVMSSELTSRGPSYAVLSRAKLC